MNGPGIRVVLEAGMARTRRITMTSLAVVALLGLSSVAWAGSGWQVTKTPDPGPNGQYQDRPLTGVAASGPNDAWAVGNYSGSGNAAAMVLHWTGRSWAKARIPTPAAHDGALDGIAQDGRSTAYAYGYQGTGSTVRLWLLHYNGHSWKAVNTSGAPTAVNMYGIAVHTIHHVWLVGYDRSTNQPIALEWRSPGWTVTHPPVPKGVEGGELNAAAFVPGTNTLTAVGYTYKANSLRETVFPYAVRYSGGAWHRLRTPTSPVGVLRAVTVLSSHNAWAVGTRYPNNSSFQTLVEHWNGTKWSTVSSPNRKGASNTLLSVGAASASDLMAVGYSCAGKSCTTRTLSEQWNGHRWSIVPSKNPHSAPGDVDELFAAAAVPRRHDFWAVGADGPARPAQGAELTLAELFKS